MQLVKSEGFEPIFVPFPGFDNLDENGRVLNK